MVEVDETCDRSYPSQQWSTTAESMPGGPSEDQLVVHNAIVN
jgi:hypothetical protein